MERSLIRCQISSYLSNEYLFRERELAHRFGLKYFLLEDIPPKGPYILITNTKTNWSSFPQGILNQTKLIIHPNSGFDNFRNYHFDCPVVLGNSIRKNAVTEYTLSAIFNWLCPIHKDYQWQKGPWKRKTLSSCRILLYGKGHIGQLLSQTIGNLGPDMTIVDPQYGNERPSGKYDIIIFACELYKNDQLLNSSLLENHCQKKALIINPARGPIIDFQAVKQFLVKNPDVTMVNDVFCHEPDDLAHYTDLPNFITTSHRAGQFDEIEDSMLDFTENVLKTYTNKSEETFLKYFNGELLHHQWSFQDAKS